MDGDVFEMVKEEALRLSPLRRGLAIDSTVDIFTFYVPHRHVYGEQWIKFMKDGVNATPLPTVNTTGYIDHAAFLGTINPDTNKIPKHLFQGYLNIYNNYFKAPFFSSRSRHTTCSRDWSSDVCSSDLNALAARLVQTRFEQVEDGHADGSEEPGHRRKHIHPAWLGEQQGQPIQQAFRVALQQSWENGVQRPVG